LLEHRNIEEVANVLLKDTGIKTAIIREYLPAMNKLINKYLNAMDTYIHFELDEAFNESIKSRFRDEFTYASFSEGEKMRIDLAILFTWRSIAKMKNSVNTNLLLLDEIFDSSLDTAGTDYFLTLMNTLGENSNIFVISHKGDQLFDKFRSVIKFEKRNDFSVISQ
jgi:ABC-type phosphate transport system ATPase subunit